MNKQNKTYIHGKRQSLKAKFFKTLLKLMGMKKALGKTLASGKIKNDPASVPKKFPKKYDFKTEKFEGRNIWTIAPKRNSSDKVIFFLHGGAYVFNMYAQHWTLLGKLVDETNAMIVVVDYPLVPQHHAEESYVYLENYYKEFVKEHGHKEIIFMGDSAGGGLAIAFAQYVRDNHLKQPAKVIAMSPWLDLSMSNPEIPSIEKLDKLLASDSLQKAGKLYAGNMNIKDPRISPIYGNFKDLKNLSIFIGTHDLFIADNRKLRARLEEEGILFNYYEYPKMPHAWVLIAMPETKAMVNQVIDLVKH